MAIGDKAAAAGLVVYPATQDARLGYENDNQRGDELATHMTTGTHPASAITSGVFAAARIPVLDIGTKTSGALPASRVGAGYPGTSVGSNGLGFPTNIDDAVAWLNANKANAGTPGGGQAADTVTAGAYGRTVGSSNFAMWMDGALNIGRNVSARRFKEQIEAHDLDPARVLALRPVSYQRVGGDGSREYGLIADDVADLVPELVTWFDGQIDGVRYDLLAVALLDVVRDQQGRLDRLEQGA